MFDKFMKIAAKAVIAAIVEAADEDKKRSDQGNRWKDRHFSDTNSDDSIIQALISAAEEKRLSRRERFDREHHRSDDLPHGLTVDQMLEALEKRKTREERRAREGRAEPRVAPPLSINRMKQELGVDHRGRPRWTPPRSIAEDVTAVLRRQVPPRNEPPRSWIGGLPMLPDSIEWPRSLNSEYPEKGEIPLNFVAQIACADLPQDLWAGLGPRTGWLIFFVATWGSDTSSDCDSFRVFHTHELGQERQQPIDKISVGDPMFSGGDNPALNYERWPVDIVTHSNAPIHPSAAPFNGTGDEPVSPIPLNFAQILYNGAPVAEGPWHPKEEPFTWGAIAMMLERTLDARARKSVRQPESKPFGPEEYDLATQALKAEMSASTLPEMLPLGQRNAAREAFLAKQQSILAEKLAFLESLGEPFNPDTLADILRKSATSRAEWRQQQQLNMVALLERASSHPPRTLLSIDEQQEMAELFSVSHVQWHIGTISPANRVRCPSKSTVTFGDIVARQKTRSVAIATRDLYRAGASERNLLPAELRDTVEANLRRLHCNRPHRMGGIHQPAQETIAPDGKVLLLQLGCDEPTGFHWGDSGGLFAWIDIDALERHDFSQVKWWTENT